MKHKSNKNFEASSRDASPEKIDRLLELLDRSTNWPEHPSERALWHLLTRWKDRLPEIDDYFHKAFRQVDVTDDGHTDMAIWCLLQTAPIFWKLFEQIRDEKCPKHPRYKGKAKPRCRCFPSKLKKLAPHP